MESLKNLKVKELTTEETKQINGGCDELDNIIDIIKGIFS